MADLYIPPGYGNAIFRCSMTGKTNLMTFTLGYLTFVPGSTAEDAASALGTSITVDGGLFTNDFIGSTFKLQDVLVYQNDAGVITSALQDLDIGGAGGLAVPPVQCSLLAQKKTSRVGRQFRGRWYLPNMFFAEADIDAMGNIAATPFGIANTAFQVSVESLLADEVATPVILHSDHAVTPTIITSMTLTTKMATQRRRARS